MSLALKQPSKRGRIVEEQADIGLIADCQQGDSRAFRRVFEIYRDRVYALCRNMAGNDQDAEDLTQESFVWAFKNIGSFRAEAAFGTWLYRIASNRCLGELRKRKPRFQSVEAMEEQGVVALAVTGPNPEEQVVRKEAVRRVEAAVAELPESQRIVFVLGTQMGMRYREIGDIVGCSEDAVKVRIHRARKRVRDAIKPFIDTELDR